MSTDKSSEREALRPCPFCGGVAVMHKVHNPDGPNDGGYYVECDKCGASTNLRFSCGEDARPLLVEQWNRRAALPQQAQDQRCNEVFEALGLDPDRYITEGGAINVPKLRATIKHPSEYLPPDHWMNSPR